MSTVRVRHDQRILNDHLVLLPLPHRSHRKHVTMKTHVTGNLIRNTSVLIPWLPSNIMRLSKRPRMYHPTCDLMGTVPGYI